MFMSLNILPIVAFVVWLQYGIWSASPFASIWIISRLLHKPRAHRGVWINGEYHPPGTYNFNDGMIKCGENGSVTVKGNRNVGNTVISG